MKKYRQQIIILATAILMALVILIFSPYFQTDGFNPVSAIAVGILFTVIIVFRSKHSLAKLFSITILWLAIILTLVI